jgi:hypothetical protein
LKGGVLARDPCTRTTISQPDGTSKPTNFRQSSELMGDDARFEDGPMLVIESEHPYRNNTNEYTTVHVQGAVSYTVSFHENTKTEAIHDFVKFFDDETHTYFFGACLTLIFSLCAYLIMLFRSWEILWRYCWIFLQLAWCWQQTTFNYSSS